MHTLFTWDKEYQYAFHTVNTAVKNAAVLSQLDPETKYFLNGDASQYAMSAVICQIQHKPDEVLCNFSNKLHDAETWHPAHDRGLFGIQDAIWYWHFNLHGARRPFWVYMDHATWCWILTQPHLTVPQIDILMVLQYVGMGSQPHTVYQESCCKCTVPLSGSPSWRIKFDCTGRNCHRWIDWWHQSRHSWWWIVPA